MANKLVCYWQRFQGRTRQLPFMYHRQTYSKQSTQNTHRSFPTVFYRHYFQKADAGQFTTCVVIVQGTTKKRPCHCAVSPSDTLLLCSYGLNKKEAYFHLTSTLRTQAWNTRCLERVGCLIGCPHEQLGVWCLVRGHLGGLEVNRQHTLNWLVRAGLKRPTGFQGTSP